MNYVILAAVLWVIAFATGTFLLYKKYGSLKNASFIWSFRIVGVIAIFFVLVVMLIIKAVM
jgi:hypothetical protein